MNTPTTLIHAPRTLNIEFLALDLSTCARCTGSLSNVDQAIAQLQQIFSSPGTLVHLDKIVVESETQAQQLRFVSSPTIRVNGHDIIILETTESSCGDCSDIAGSSQGTVCRTWLYQGESYTEAPVGLIVDAILRELYQNEASTPVAPETFVVPQNLQRFFQNKANKTAACCGSTAAETSSCGCS